MEQELTKYGWVAAVIYVLVKDVLPALSRTVTRWLELYVPARSKERQMEIKQNDDLEERRIALREREVTVMESMAKTMTAIDTRLQAMDMKLDQKHDVIGTALVSANQALAIILDRTNRRREDYGRGLE